MVKFTDIRGGEKEIKSFKWIKPHRYHLPHRLVPFLITCIVAILSINLLYIGFRGYEISKEVKTLTLSGYNALNTAKTKALDAEWEESIEKFDESLAFFKRVQETGSPFEGSLAIPEFIGKTGENLSNAGRSLAETANQIIKLPSKLLITQKAGIDLSEELSSYKPKVEQITTDLKNALVSINKINEILIPKEFEEQFKSGKVELENMIAKSEELKSSIDVLLNLLGHKSVHRYLILVQNDAEIRPGGGFLGNVIFIDVSNGLITKIEPRDVYDFDGQLTENIPVPPEYKGFIEKLWIRDANFNPDFEITAKLVDSMIQKAGGINSDTIISVNQSIIGDLLAITGGVEVPSHKNAKITKSNYRTVFTYLGGERALIPEFVSILKDKIFNINEPSILISLITDNTKLGSIKAYSFNPEIQKIIEKLNLDGKLTDVNEYDDYFLLTHTSIGGNKTDLYIKESISHSTLIERNGKITDTVIIKARHAFGDSEESKWLAALAPFGIEKLNEEMRFILGRGDNISQMKLYVPLGTKLVSASEEVQTINDPEINRTYFLFKRSIKPQQLSQISISYTLPKNLPLNPVAAYKLIIDRVAVTNEVTFSKEFETKPGVKAFRYYPTTYELSQDGTYSHFTSLGSVDTFITIFGKTFFGFL